MQYVFFEKGTRRHVTTIYAEYGAIIKQERRAGEIFELSYPSLPFPSPPLPFPSLIALSIPVLPRAHISMGSGGPL